MTQTIFSHRINKVPRTFLRELLDVATDKNIISFAGGLPNPQFFPIQAFKKATDKVLTKYGTEILQYGSTEGCKLLREFIAQRYWKKKGLKISAEEILITNGSQQGIDLLAKVFLNKSDGVLIENPSYLAAIMSLSLYEPKFFSLDLKKDGPDTSKLHNIISSNKIKLLYSIPNFQNPTGITYSEKKRKEIAKILDSSNIVIIEDDPYGEISFNKSKLTSFKQLYQNTVLLGSFSKIVAPGYRLGWVHAPKEILEKIYIAKQASDLHSSYFTQRIVLQYLQDNDIDAHIKKIQKCYSLQKTAMISAIKKYLPKDVSFTNPDGGMFLWITLPEKMNAVDLYYLAIKEGVAFVPGESFFVEKIQKNTLRVNFSNVPPDKIEKGIMLLSKAFKKM